MTRAEANVLLALAHRLGAEVEIVLISNGTMDASRFGYVEIEGAHLCDCANATLLVYDPARAACLFARTVTSETHAPITLDAIDDALRSALAEYAQRFPGTLP